MGQTLKNHSVCMSWQKYLRMERQFEITSVDKISIKESHWNIMIVQCIVHIWGLLLYGLGSLFTKTLVLFETWSDSWNWRVTWYISDHWRYVVRILIVAGWLLVKVPCWHYCTRCGRHWSIPETQLTLPRLIMHTWNELRTVPHECQLRQTSYSSLCHFL